MISIQGTINELEKSERLRLFTLECYVAAIRAAAQYAIDLDSKETLEHRAYLNTLATEVEGAPEDLAESRANFREIVRHYRDEGLAYMARLREDLANTASALQRILGTLSQSESDHELHLRQAVRTLHELSHTAGDGAIASMLESAANNIEESLGELRKQQQLANSQFVVEIGVLHKRVAALESAAIKDKATEFFNREEMERRIRFAKDTDSLLLLSLKGLRRAEAMYGPKVQGELTRASAKRLGNALPEQTVIGRWGEEEFVAIIGGGKSAVMGLAKQVVNNLSGVYPCLENGRTVRPLLQADTAVLERGAAQDIDLLIKRIGQFLKD